MSQINYGDPEPHRRTHWRSPSGTVWSYFDGGWRTHNLLPDGVPFYWGTGEWCAFSHIAFPMKEAPDAR